MTDHWFQISTVKGDSLRMILDIAEQIMPRFKIFFSDAEFSEWLQKPAAPIGFEDLVVISIEAEEALMMEVSRLRSTLENNRGWPPRIRLRRAYQRITDSGLNGESLLIKLRVVEELWKQVIERLRRSGRSMAVELKDLSSPVVKALKIFFKYLNVLLSSLQKVITSFESVVELKDFMLASIDLYREAKDLATNS